LQSILNYYNRKSTVQDIKVKYSGIYGFMGLWDLWGLWDLNGGWNI
jgi:hypothetical protein